MNLEISKARGVEEFPNPLSIANLFHYIVASVCFVAGMYLGVTSTGGGVIDVVPFSGALFLIFVSIIHGAWAWRYSYFAIAPENIGPLDSGVHQSEAAYVDDVIAKGIPVLDQASGALANMLLKLVPGIRHAPRFIQIFALTQWERTLFSSACLMSFSAAMILTWGQPSQAFVAWLYLLLVLFRVFSPLSVVVKLLLLQPEAAGSLGTSVRKGDLLLFVGLIVAPLVSRIVASQDIEALSGLSFSPFVIWATLALLVTAVLTGALSYLALVAQTSELERTKADVKVEDLPSGKADMSHAFKRLDTFLHKFVGAASVHALAAREILKGSDPVLPSRKGTQPFYGSRFLETSPRAGGATKAGDARERLAEAGSSKRERPLLMLGVAGSLAILAFVAMLLWLVHPDREWAGVYEILISLTVTLGFLAAAEHAFAVAHKLWQRFDFTSEVLKIEVVGNYMVDEQVLRDQLSAPSGIVRTGSETTSAIHSISGASLKVSHFMVYSTSYMIGSARTITGVISKAHSFEVIRDVLEQSIIESHEARRAVLQGEMDLKAAYGAVIPALGSSEAAKLPDTRVDAMSSPPPSEGG